jgi:hypothetical protein
MALARRSTARHFATNGRSGTGEVGSLWRSVRRTYTAMPSQIPSKIVTPLKKCAVCGGSLSLTTHKPVQAKCYDLVGIIDVEHSVKECCRRTCRVHHQYNFYILGKKKVNTLKFDQLKMVFVTANTAFSMRFLRYQANHHLSCLRESARRV